MNISLINGLNQTYNLKNLNFKGENYNEYVDGKKLIHETCFFREPNTDEFVKKYIEKTFLSKNQPVNIVVGACSTGYEAYTQAMLYDEYSDKVNILGFDIGPKSIEAAKAGIFLIQDVYDKYLPACTHRDAYLATSGNTERQKEYVTLFRKYFDEIDYSKPKDDYENLYMYRRNIIFEKFYKLKENYGKNCSFKLGDITRMDDLAPDNSVHCLFFRNALYHLVCSSGNRNFEDYDGEKIKQIALEARKKLVDGGLFVFGEREFSQGVDVEKVYKIMTECGFEPINTQYRRELNPYLVLSKAENTNVWRKVGLEN